MTDIFISYASKDRERLRPLRDALEAGGWSVFWDQQIPVGKNWRRNIFEHLRAARCVIVAWSSASIESDWVSEEAADALKREVLLPIYIDQLERIGNSLGLGKELSINNLPISRSNVVPIQGAARGAYRDM